MSLASRLGSNSPLADAFDVVLNGCAITFALLDEQLADVCKMKADEDHPSWADRVRYLWNEDVIRTAIHQMSSMQNAINLLLTVLQT